MHCVAIRETLEELDASWCRGVTAQGLGLLADSCPNLNSLRLFGCSQVLQSWPFIVHSCLATLSMPGSNPVPISTNECVSNLEMRCIWRGCITPPMNARNIRRKAECLMPAAMEESQLDSTWSLV